ncbi:hypothetical protein Psal027_03512 (plasmid) [Piscirickettsia salmonis]|uniref:Uncharacterized protein n=1 Tax=Piscirickettsia salmonis TaxID=1238 RepID=A0A9Q6LI63_PISSA|nr:hypothetical protein Psal001_03464 [Piscirickettsia salmonis]QGN82790.1 hypothetical protein Psal002_03490 [Piscirickettsia salmonis]QGN86302.1 hypothetical protein Psal003_03411 [Piscirickettsia salmonis]QGN89806.1 hypothetical protein Psal004_03401 [Piscirickettsia salmonis]QGO04546.1 hypothetical protein Psal009_00415 [Piscirickettsia salmonis]
MADLENLQIGPGLRSFRVQPVFLIMLKNKKERGFMIGVLPFMNHYQDLRIDRKI